MNKNEVTEKLNSLRKIGFKVFHCNSKNKMPAGLRFLTDHIIIGNSSIVFIEDKLTRGEKLSDGQKELMKHITAMQADNIIGLVNYGDDVDAIIDTILKLEKIIISGR